MAVNYKNEKKIITYINNEIPYLIKVNCDKITLGEFKSLFKFNNNNNKYFFKNIVNQIGVVKELITEDHQELPILNKCVVAYIVTFNLGEIHNHNIHRGTRECSKCAEYEIINMDLEERYDNKKCNEDDEFSITTEITSVSQNKVRTFPRKGHLSSFRYDTNNFMVPNIIEVDIHMDKLDYLGIKLVSNNNSDFNEGVCVASVLQGGAVDLDSRIKQGDVILQVNDVKFENMSNFEAIKVIKEIAQNCETIKFVVLKCWNSNHQNCFSPPRNEPVRPIDLSAWVAHTEASRGDFYKSSSTLLCFPFNFGSCY